MTNPSNNASSIKAAALLAIRISVFLFAAATLARRRSIFSRSRWTN